MRNWKALFSILFLAVLIGFLEPVKVQAAGGQDGALQEEWVDYSEYIIREGGFAHPEERDDAQMPRYLNPAEAMERRECAKECLYQGLKERQQEISLEEYSISRDEYDILYPELLNEHPELFFVEGKSKLYLCGECVESIQPKYNDLYPDNAYEQLVTVATRIIEEIPDEYTDEQVLVYLHEYLVTHVEYDYTFTYYSAYGALVKGTSVCQGYAEAYDLLVNMAGIPCYLVSSYAENHAWNLVLLDGKYYYVDCTWDDPGDDEISSSCHFYMLISRDECANTHDAGTDWWAYGLGNVYDTYGIDSTKYDDYYWRDFVTIIKYNGTKFVYLKPVDKEPKVYIRDINGEVQEIVLPNDGFVWHIKGSGGWWIGNYSSLTTPSVSESQLIAYGDFCYVSMSDRIYKVSLFGDYEVIYTLTEAEKKAQDYIYDLQASGEQLNYYLKEEPYAEEYTKKTISLKFEDIVDLNRGETIPKGSTRMYRLYNPNSGEHFYTGNVAEVEMLFRTGWKFEGRAWYAPTTSKTPVYRLYNPNAGDHHYTPNKAERDMLVSVGWNDEGIGWYSAAKSEEPLYRLYNPNAVTGSHHYTTNPAERDMLVMVGWNDEGIGWYGCK